MRKDLDSSLSWSNDSIGTAVVLAPPGGRGSRGLSESILRGVLVRVDPAELAAALQRWSADFAAADDSLAVDGKTLCNAIDADGRQCHVLSAVGHDLLACHTQKKSACSRAPTTA